jgi:5-methylcytosine-specific restriction endonuclease McrA
MNEDYYLTIKGVDRCSVCGSIENIHIHHKNGNHFDNRPENLIYLCNLHHSKEHKRFIPNRDKLETTQIDFRFNPKLR